MATYFCAQISQEHSSKVENMALNLGIPKKNILFNTIGCPLGSIGVYIKFEDITTFNLFSNEVKQDIPHSILEKW